MTDLPTSSIGRIDPMPELVIEQSAIVDLRTLDEINKEAVILRLKYFHGSKPETAKSLGCTIKTVYNWLNKWGIK